MCKKLIYLACFVLVLALAGNALAAADPSLVIYYSFDEVGEIIADQSGKGHDGTVNGDITAEPAGKCNGAAKFTSGSYLDLDGENFPAEDIPTSGITLAAWIKCENTGGHHAIFNARAADNTWLIHPEARSNGEFRWLLRFAGGNTIFDIRAGAVTWDEWLHFAGIYDKASGKAALYINGELVKEENISNPQDIAGDWKQGARVGYNIDAARPFTGLMDEFCMFKRALSQAEIKSIMQGGMGSPRAFGPDPADGTFHPDTWATISWYPGENAASHDMYFGDDFDDVNAGVESTFQGNQTATYLVVGFPGFACPEGLVPGTTYYWRIDEVEADGTTIHKGDVWSFMVPPKTAYNPGPADGTESVDPNTAMLSWTAGFGAKLHTVYFGDNFDEVSSAAGGLPQGDTTYTPGILELEKAYYWRVDEFDVVATYKGEVWSFTTPGAVGSPEPSNGATDVKQTQILSWLPAVHAASHQVYFGTDKELVRSANTGSPEYKGTKDLDSDSYDPGKLEWDTTYYWRVDEVETDGTIQKGLVWSFTTANFLVVDDFESYNDLDPDDPESNRIFNAWLDGLDNPENGSTVGYENPPFAEQSIVHSGSQSMPLFYDNSVGYSEASMTLVYPRDWTEKGVSTLAIWFRGSSGNAAESMYVALNGSAVVSHSNPEAAQIAMWTKWTIDLQQFADQGVDLTNVDTIALGLGDKNNPQAGGAGKMYFDDIRLYPSAPTDATSNVVLDIRIATDTDDAEEDLNPSKLGEMDLGSSDLELAYEDTGMGDPMIVGVRFTDIGIPAGSSIIEAWVRFQVDEDKDGTLPVNLLIEGELTANPGTFLGDAFNISNRPRTVANVQWSVPNWETVGDQGPDQTTPNIASIIEEIVGQAGWASGNALVIIFSDDPANPSEGIRCAESGVGDDSALLHVEAVVEVATQSSI